jgi:hypothetical protein
MAEMIKLAPMECAASCTLNFLQRNGFDPVYFLLHYWNLSYTSQVLLSGKHTRLFPLDTLYGIETTFGSGDRQEVMRVLDQKAQLLLVCKASGLPFFPRNMLTYEEAGFAHFVLVTGYEEEGEQYWVVDPIAEYEGTISWDELQAASLKQNELQYLILMQQTQNFQAPPVSYIVRTAAEQNWSAYTDVSKTHSGMQALDRFVEDIKRSVLWEDEQRETWVFQNNISIASIIRTRGLVWESFRSLAHLEETDHERVEMGVKEIQKQWTGLNFLLVKYKRDGSDKLRMSMEGVVSQLKRAELQVLQAMHKLGSLVRES